MVPHPVHQPTLAQPSPKLPWYRRVGLPFPVFASSAPDHEVWAASLLHPDRFTELFDRHWMSVRAYCVAGAGLAEGERAAAAVFREAFDARCRVDPDQVLLRGWIFGLAVRRLEAQARHGGRWQPPTRELELTAGTFPDPVCGIDDLRGPLAQLRPEERQILELEAWTPLTYEEMAQALDLPVGAVRQRAINARSRLRGEGTGTDPATATDATLERVAADLARLLPCDAPRPIVRRERSALRRYFSCADRTARRSVLGVVAEHEAAPAPRAGTTGSAAPPAGPAPAPSRLGAERGTDLRRSGEDRRERRAPVVLDPLPTNRRTRA